MSDREHGNNAEKIGGAKRQRSCAGESGKQRFRDLIESERRAAHLEPESPLGERREAIARHRANADDCTQSPRYSDEVRCEGRDKDRCGDAAPRFRATEQAMPVPQHDPGVDRSSKAPPEETLE